MGKPSPQERCIFTMESKVANVPFFDNVTGLVEQPSVRFDSLPFHFNDVAKAVKKIASINKYLWV